MFLISIVLFVMCLCLDKICMHEHAADIRNFLLGQPLYYLEVSDEPALVIIMLALLKASLIVILIKR